VKFGLLDCFEQKDIYLQYAIYNGLNTALTPYEYKASTTATKGYVIFNVGAGGDILSMGKLFASCILFAVTCSIPIYGLHEQVQILPCELCNSRVGVFNMGRNLSIKILIPLNLRKTIKNKAN